MLNIQTYEIRAGAIALGRRALGLGFLALALAPLLLVAAVLFVVIDTTANVVAVSRAKVTAVTEVLDKELTPRIAAIESGYQDSVRGTENVGAQFTQVSRSLGNIPDITLQRGQLGETQPFPLHVPDGDVNMGLFHIGDGQLFNQTLPSLQLPAAAISIPTTPIRQALAPLGENGPIAHAIADSSAQVGQAVDQVKRLGAPLSQLQSEIGAWFAPLRDFGQRIALLAEVTVAVLALLLVLYAAATIHVAVTRRREGAMAFQFGGPLGYRASCMPTCFWMVMADCAAAIPPSRRSPSHLMYRRRSRVLMPRSAACATSFRQSTTKVTTVPCVLRPARPCLPPIGTPRESWSLRTILRPSYKPA
jgi:hypothetical protein